MKNIIILWISVLCTLSIQAQKNKEMDLFQVQVDGLGCPFCAYGLEKKFKEFKGIKDVKIDIETGDFSFQYPAQQALSLDKVITQVSKAGYTPNLATIQRADGSVETNKKPKNNDVVGDAKLTTKKLTVFGNCEMCKARIEKAALDLPGVAEAQWNQKEKILEVHYDSVQTDLLKINEATAAVGHDTKTIKASDADYKALPACCHYKRVQK